MRKGFIVRDRSLTTFPSKQLSVNQFMQQKSIALQTYRSKQFQQSKLLSQKQQDITKLKTNLNHALNMAVNEAIQNSRSKQQSMRTTQTKMFIQKKYMEVSEQLNEQRNQKIKLESSIAEIEYQLNKQREQKKRTQQKMQQTMKQLDKANKQVAKISLLEQIITQIQPLKSRIKSLQNLVRQQKLKNQQMNRNNRQLEKVIEDLKQNIKQTKPYQQQLLQRIAFLERVNLQLQRKMEDFHRREHQYKKQIQHYKTALSKMTIDRNKFRQDYESTYSTLQQKLQLISLLETQIQQKDKMIQELNQKLEKKTSECQNFSKKLQQTIDYYKNIIQENGILKKKNAALQQNEQQMRRVLQSHLKVSQETNLYIIQRNSQLLKLQDEKKHLIQTLQAVERKFVKLDRLFQENSARGQNQIKESFYATLKQRNKFELELKEVRQQLSQKILKFGEERDVFHRKISTYQIPIPKQQTLYEAIIADKIQMIITLQSSNDQLIKVKKQQQDRIRFLQKQTQNYKRQIHNLRLKAAQLFKTKKDLEDTRARAERYQQMIQDQKSQISDLNSQLDILRSKNVQISQKNYSMSMQNRNLNFKITQYENVMKQLDIEYLNQKKAQNEKNAHVLVDSVQKLQNGINSLAYYFSCCFCNELLNNNPITLAICGHNYCTKCKDAYAQYCYQCDTGQPIEKVYSSKFLKEAAGKYKFLVMVMKQAQNNLIKVKT